MKRCGVPRIYSKRGAKRKREGRHVLVTGGVIRGGKRRTDREVAWRIGKLEKKKVGNSLFGKGWRRC